jgi:hypothetical protein
MISKALKDDPELARALSLYSMGQREYVRALASLRSVTITSSGEANPGGANDGQSDSDDPGD